jgi:hypothetical protein
MSLLQRHRRALRPGASRQRSLSQELVAEALVARAEADLRWLDRCEERLLQSTDDMGGGAAGNGR